jgi:NADH:ubiquinone oxidoreductase subunit B-like Fe-S oxidoreductase
LSKCQSGLTSVNKGITELQKKINKKKVREKKERERKKERKKDKKN